VGKKDEGLTVGVVGVVCRVGEGRGGEKEGGKAYLRRESVLRTMLWWR